MILVRRYVALGEPGFGRRHDSELDQPIDELLVHARSSGDLVTGQWRDLDRHASGRSRLLFDPITRV